MAGGIPEPTHTLSQRISRTRHPRERGGEPTNGVGSPLTAGAALVLSVTQIEDNDDTPTRTCTRSHGSELRLMGYSPSAVLALTTNGGSFDLAARSREEASHVLQHIDLADPQSSRRLRGKRPRA